MPLTAAQKRALKIAGGVAGGVYALGVASTMITDWTRDLNPTGQKAIHALTWGAAYDVRQRPIIAADGETVVLGADGRPNKMENTIFKRRVLKSRKYALERGVPRDVANRAADGLVEGSEVRSGTGVVNPDQLTEMVQDSNNRHMLKNVRAGGFDAAKWGGRRARGQQAPRSSYNFLK